MTDAITTLTQSGAVLWKAGKNVSTDLSGAHLAEFINEAEGVIAARTRKDWVGAYSGLSDNTKKILDEAASNLAAMYAIQYDMSGYTSRTEAEIMLDVLRDGLSRDLQILQDKKVEDFLV